MKIIVLILLLCVCASAQSTVPTTEYKLRRIAIAIRSHPDSTQKPGELRLYEADSASTDYAVILRAPNSLDTTVRVILPDSLPTANGYAMVLNDSTLSWGLPNQSLYNDVTWGDNTDGTMIWTFNPSGGINPAIGFSNALIVMYHAVRFDNNVVQIDNATAPSIRFTPANGVTHDSVRAFVGRVTAPNHFINGSTDGDIVVRAATDGDIHFSVSSTSSFGRVISINDNGDLEFASSGNTINANSEMAGQDNFVGTASTDTVDISSASVTDIFIAALEGDGNPLPDDAIKVKAIDGGLVVTRNGGGLSTSGLSYNWLRIKP